MPKDIKAAIDAISRDRLSEYTVEYPDGSWYSVTILPEDYFTRLEIA